MIVSVKTSDGLRFNGTFVGAKKSKSVVIFIHGTASNFHENEFINNEALKLISYSILLTNNRGAFSSGSETEKFEDSVKDIDAWMKFVISKGYKNIILSGHSLGTEKVVYYMNKGKYKNKVKSVILFAPADSYGCQLRFLKGDLGKRLMDEAKSLVKKGQGNKLLTSIKLCHAGVQRKSALSYINFFKENSELSKAFPLRSGKLQFYKRTKVPILAILGDNDKWVLTSSKKVLEMLKKENKRTEIHLIKNCNHDFEGKEDKILEIVNSFVKRD